MALFIRPFVGRVCCYRPSSFGRSSSGSLAKFTAIRRPSSRVNRLVAERCDAAICPKSGEKRKCGGCTRNDVDDAKPAIKRGGYLNPLLATFFLISGLSYRTTFNRELRISSFPLYSM
jgi:hypothetical protein